MDYFVLIMRENTYHRGYGVTLKKKERNADRNV